MMEEREGLGVPDSAGLNEFGLEISEWLARHSKLSYLGFSAIAETLSEAGFDEILFFRSGGANAYLTRGKTAQDTPVWILAFRGTESDYNDILVDVTFFKRTADYEREYRTHGGFLTSLQSFWGSWGKPDALDSVSINAELWGPKGISEALQEKVGSDRLFITGHSLGGALASLAAYYVQRDLGCTVAGLYTFGCPRVYDGDMSAATDRSANVPSIRYVNAADIVARVPPAILGYRHFGEKHYLTRDGEMQDKPTISEIWWDVGWMRLSYFALMLLVASTVVWGLTRFVSEEHPMAWIASGWSVWVIGLIIAVALSIFFTRALPYIPRWLCKRVGIKEFTDHGIGEYVRKLHQLNARPGESS